MGRRCPGAVPSYKPGGPVNLLDKCQELVAEELGLEPSQVTQDTRLDEPTADDLQRLEIIMAMEEEFGISIPDDDVDRLATVGEAVSYLEEKGAAA